MAVAAWVLYSQRSRIIENLSAYLAQLQPWTWEIASRLDSVFYPARNAQDAQGQGHEIVGAGCKQENDRGAQGATTL